MKLEQKAITTIYADDGKLLVRKSDGQIAGDSVTLGYNYYEAGIPLSEPHLETPDDYEEQDKPIILDEEVVNETPIKVDHMNRLKRASAIIRSMRDELDSLGLTPQESLEIKDLYHHYGEGTFSVGSHVTKNMKCQYGGNLYAVIKEHDILPHYGIDANTIGTLYDLVDENYKDIVEEEGVAFEG
mgnify:CR=1 FL=1